MAPYKVELSKASGGLTASTAPNATDSSECSHKIS